MNNTASPDIRILNSSSHDNALLSDGTMELRADFSRMLPRVKSGRLHGELIVKAARIKGTPTGTRPVALDATAGLGEDALLLAAAGFTVHLFERNAKIAQLLRSALLSAGQTPELAPYAAHMHMHEEDSIPVLQALARPESQDGRAAEAYLGGRPAVVLLDPMFPERTKSAAVKKKFQLLHHLEVPCSPAEEEALLQAALAAHPTKVVVKRPAKGPHLCASKPSYSLVGKAVRFDVYA